MVKIVQRHLHAFKNPSRFCNFHYLSILFLGILVNKVLSTTVGQAQGMGDLKRDAEVEQFLAVPFGYWQLGCLWSKEMQAWRQGPVQQPLRTLCRQVSISKLLRG